MGISRNFCSTLMNGRSPVKKKKKIFNASYKEKNSMDFGHNFLIIELYFSSSQPTIVLSSLSY